MPAHLPPRRTLCALLAPGLAVASLAAASPAAASSVAAGPARIAAFAVEKDSDCAVFAGPLARHGEWLRLAGGGSAWRPGGIGEAWRPYLHGSWVFTEQGWYWVSEEPWAWATYHYGRWRHDSRLGWIWLPGDEWAPAWVVWRRGPGVVGWAPRAEEGDVLAAHFTVVPADRLEGTDAAAHALHPARIPALLFAARPGEAPAPPVSSRWAAR